MPLWLISFWQTGHVVVAISVAPRLLDLLASQQEKRTIDDTHSSTHSPVLRRLDLRIVQFPSFFSLVDWRVADLGNPPSLFTLPIAVV